MKKSVFFIKLKRVSVFVFVIKITKLIQINISFCPDWILFDNFCKTEKHEKQNKNIYCTKNNTHLAFLRILNSESNK